MRIYVYIYVCVCDLASREEMRVCIEFVVCGCVSDPTAAPTHPPKLLFLTH